MNLEDIAKLAGVSRSTVSRVVNDDPNVRETVRARVQSVIRDVGYQPNAAARALASQRSQAIGLVVPEDFSQRHVDTWYPRIIEAILAAARARNLGLLLILEDAFSKDAGRRIAEQYLETARVDGLFLLQHSYNDFVTPYLMQRGVPVVLIGESHYPDVVWVDNDNFADGRLAARALHDAGTRSPLVVSQTAAHVPSCRRRLGFAEQMRELGVVVRDGQAIETGFDLRQTQRDIYRFLSDNADADGIYVVNEWLASEVFRMAGMLGKRIPEDLAVIAHDEFETERNAILGLTTIVQHVDELAERAVAALVELIQPTNGPPVETILSSRVVPRMSCREDWHGATARPWNAEGGYSAL